MEGLFKPPEILQVDGNISENWRKFSQKIDNFFVATGLDAKPEEKKIAAFLNLIGDNGLEIYNTFKWEENEQVTLEKVKQKFVAYCSPKKNVVFERFVFNSITQKEGQSFDNFLTEIRKAVRTTEYANQDEVVRDRVVMGIYNKSTQEKLLGEATLTLDKAINMCRAIELSKEQSKILQSEASISEVRSRNSSRKDKQENKQNCHFCGYTHQKKNCPAWGKTCAKCQGHNHYANMCENSKKKENDTTNKKRYSQKEVQKASKKVNRCGSESDSDTSEYELKTKEVLVNDKPVMFKLDTGAEDAGDTRSFQLSPELSALVGAESMTRYEVVKKIWSIIKENDLCDPEDKQYAICDDALLKVIGIKRFRTFGMMEYLKPHFIS